jgi:hypothetical protein
MQSFANGPTSHTPNTGPSHHVLIDGNRCERIDTGVLKAFALANNSSGATIGGNKISDAITYEVSADETSKVDYTGPTPEGKP